MNKKKILAISGIILIIILGLLIFFSNKSNKETKFVENENNYTLKFDYYFEKKLNQRITFIYRDKVLDDVTLTLYLENKETARAVYEAYKSEKEFKNYETEKNRVILHYKDKDIKDYMTSSKEDLIQEFTQMGYVYTK